MMGRLQHDGIFIFEKMEKIGINEGAACREAEKVLGDGYKVDISVPEPKIQKVMAEADMLGLKRISFEYLISRILK